VKTVVVVLVVILVIIIFSATTLLKRRKKRIPLEGADPETAELITRKSLILLLLLCTIIALHNNF